MHGSDTSNFGTQRGFTYVAMLVAVAIIGIGLAAAGQVWSVASQREREQKLLFVGHEIRHAIRLYYEQTPGAVKRYPMTLEDLLADKRYPNVKRYLRRIYPDPMTGKSEWGMVAAPGGGVQGVYSVSPERPLKQSGFEPQDVALQGAASFAAWRFIYDPTSYLASPAPARVPR